MVYLWRETCPNLNIYWIVAVAPCIWFLFIHAPVFLAGKTYVEPLLIAHLIGAYSIYLACAHNTLITPSLFQGSARPFHVWIGRVALVLGVIGFISGMTLAWVNLDPSEELGGSIAITAGGVVQMLVQFFGFRAIRKFQNIRKDVQAGNFGSLKEKQALEDKQDKHLAVVHIWNMLILFLFGCGAPGYIRLAESLPWENGFAIFFPILMVGALLLSYLMVRVYVKRTKAKRASQRAQIAHDGATDEANGVGFGGKGGVTRDLPSVEEMDDIEGETGDQDESVEMEA